jgi:RNA polymerase sigma-32 factor
MSTTALVRHSPAELALAGPIGSFDAYVDTVSRIPVLSREEELVLANRFHGENDLEAARQLVLSHLRFVMHIARGYAGYGLPISDIVQEGNVGLMKAVKRFDPAVGVRLVSFAVHWIRAEIHEYVLRNWRLVKVATTKAQRKLFFNLRRMKTSTAALSPADARAIANELAVKPEEVVEMETRLSGRDVVLDPQPDENGDSMGPIAWLTDTEDEPMQILERRQTATNRTKGLSTALAKLDERSRRIIESRWLREDDPATLQDLADEYGVSAERIRQIEVKAMKSMRAQMGAPT